MDSLDCQFCLQSCLSIHYTTASMTLGSSIPVFNNQRHQLAIITFPLHPLKWARLVIWCNFVLFLKPNFSVATNYAYKSKDGGIIIETTWHNVVAWEGDSIHGLDKLKKGSSVHVCGRLRNRKYLAPDGSERTTCDILAGSLKIVQD